MNCGTYADLDDLLAPHYQSNDWTYYAPFELQSSFQLKKNSLDHQCVTSYEINQDPNDLHYASSAGQRQPHL